MLRFIKHHFDTMNDVEIYPIISLLLFFTVFITMLIYVIKMPKKNLEEISNMPLEGNENNNNYE
jgi:cytochrome c oxidase cbb3-type subunit 4